MDITLNEEIRAASHASDLSFPPRNVLITGATGFLGSHVLDELLRSTDAHIYCLVRANSPEKGYAKLEKTAALYNIEWKDLPLRVTPVLGDLAEPGLGMSEQQFSDLSDKLDTIYHCGAFVNFVQSYDSLKPANVNGTREVLRLAATGPLKAVHHTSSIAVFESDTFESIKYVVEDEDLGKSQGFHNGYDTSKWVSERIISLARDRSIPVSIYRLSNIAGHSKTGVMLPQHIIASLMKGCIQMGVAPAEDKIVNLLRWMPPAKSLLICR